MIIYPFNPPTTPGFTSLRITLDDAVAVSASPYTYTQQAFANQGQQWTFEVSVAPMKGDAAGPWEAWFAAMRGRYGIFNLGDSARKSPRGTAAVALSPGYAYINGGGQTGMTISTAGWANSQTVLKAGDYIQLACVNEFTGEFTGEFGGSPIARLHKVLQDVTSDSSGHASIDIWPRLRSSPVNGATIITSNCKGTFRLADNTRSWDINTAKIYGFSFKAVEAL